MIRHLVTAATAVVLAIALAGPASAHGGVRYHLALGDSIATGRQAVPVTPNQGYVAQLHRTLSAKDPALRLVNLACDGETTTSMRSSGGLCSYSAGNQVDAAVEFLRSHRGRVRLITITVGGNDIAPCGLTGTVDHDCVAAAMATISVNLTRTMAELRAVAPKVTIVGMTLYDAFLASWLAGPAGQEFARQSIPVTQAVNRVIASSYRAVGARVADVEAAFSTTDLTTMVTLPEVGTVPLAVARICQWTSMCLPPPTGPDFHPNTAGYTVIKKAFQPLV